MNMASISQSRHIQSRIPDNKGNPFGAPYWRCLFWGEEKYSRQEKGEVGGQQSIRDTPWKHTSLVSVMFFWKEKQIVLWLCDEGVFIPDQ